MTGWFRSRILRPTPPPTRPPVVLPPVPVPASLSHCPPDWPLLVDDAFNDLVTPMRGMAWNDEGYSSIVTDLTAPRSPGNVLEMRYPIGFAGGVGPGNAWFALPSLRRIFVEFWWKVSDPWQGHESNVNKIVFLFPSSGGDIYLAMYGPPGGPYELRVLPQFPGLPSEWLVPNLLFGDAGRVRLGDWHRVEWMLDMDASLVQWWLDGRQAGERDVPFPAGAMTELKLNPTWGGVGDVKTENDYYRFDHLRISGA